MHKLPSNLLLVRNISKFLNIIVCLSFRLLNRKYEICVYLTSYYKYLRQLQLGSIRATNLAFSIQNGDNMKYPMISRYNCHVTKLKFQLGGASEGRLGWDPREDLFAAPAS